MILVWEKSFVRWELCVGIEFCKIGWMVKWGVEGFVKKVGGKFGLLGELVVW